MNLKIRQASKKDIPLILGLLYELGRPKPKTDSEVDSFRKIVKNQIAESNNYILIAEVDEIHVVGLASIVLLRRLNQTKNEMYIPELVVTQKYQNQGIGTKLIDECIELAKEKRCFRIRLESGLSRTIAHNFYKKLGFESNSFSFSKKID